MSISKRTTPNLDIASRYREVAAYRYLDPRGVEVFQHVRYVVESDAGRDKSFAYRYAPTTQREIDRARSMTAIAGRLYVWGKPQGADDLLYHLPEVLEAKDSEAIYWCEGEKDADTLRALGLVATSHHGGAGAVHVQQCAWLNGARHVILCVDRDIPGAYDALLRYSGTRSQVERVEVVKGRVPGDVSDHLQAGYGPEELVPVPVETLRKAAAGYTPFAAAAAAGYRPALGPLYAEVRGMFEQDPDWPKKIRTVESRHGDLPTDIARRLVRRGL